MEAGAVEVGVCGRLGITEAPRSFANGLTVPPADNSPPPIDLSLWRACGARILAFYGLTCIVHGGIYRPKGVDYSNPAFYALPLITLFPFVTLLVEQRRRARSTKSI